MIDSTRMMWREIEKPKEEKLDLISLICGNKAGMRTQSMENFTPTYMWLNSELELLKLMYGMPSFLNPFSLLKLVF